MKPSLTDAFHAMVGTHLRRAVRVRAARGGDPLRKRRGMALLLVMVGMIVCTILTAGFLSTQGTSIGIARNERDAAKSRAIAQTGIDMCYWLIKNRSDWRTTMTPGSWLTNTAIGDGTVSVSVTDGDGTGSFYDDNTQAVVLTSTGSYDSRSLTLTASIRPTGGGTVFYNGNFVSGSIQIGNNDLLTAATVDSYDSSVGAYNALSPGSNANFVSDAVGNSSLLVYFPSVLRGSYTAGPTAPLGSVVGLVNSLLGVLPVGPSSIGALTENRNPGTVVFPNTTGLANLGAFNWSNQFTSKTAAAGKYTSFTVKSDTVFASSGITYVAGNMSISNTGTSIFNVPDGVNAVYVVDGSLTVDTGKITLTGTGQLAIYCNGSITITNGSVNNGGNTSRLTIFGGSSGGSITMTSSNAIVYGSIYAPQHTLKMQTVSPKIFGAVCVQSLTMKDSSALHFDEALRALRISNITGGSASPGTADYRISITGGPGINR